MDQRLWLPLARFVMAGVVCWVGNASAQQSGSLAGSPAASKAAPVTDAVPLEELSKAPAVTINNGQISAKVYLPDTEKGFYRGTRFDWAGVIGSLTYGGHDFFVPWFRAMSPSVRDFVFQDDALITSSNNATGPAEEFNAEGSALGYAQAAPGGVFLKIGVGVLRRPDDAAYSAFRKYPIVDAGKRKHAVKDDRVEFTHEVADPGSGYAYHYVKTIRLVGKEPVLLIEHVLRNAGTQPIATMVYNHNFINIDGAGTTQGLELNAAFTLAVDKAPDPILAEVSGNKVLYRTSLPIDQRVAARLTGFGATAADNDFHILDRHRGAGLRITGDQPLARALLWSIRPVMAIEPFITMTIAPGESFKWSYRYQFEAGAAHSSGESRSTMAKMRRTRVLTAGSADYFARSLISAARPVNANYEHTFDLPGGSRLLARIDGIWTSAHRLQDPSPALISRGATQYIYTGNETVGSANVNWTSRR